jgi:anti-sigma regulatory factor (Ser/Thr protein kinase)
VEGHPVEARLSVPAEPASASAARRFVERTLRGWHCQDDTVEKVVLLTSELVTNAILHARDPIHVVIETTGAAVRVEVRDGAPGMPVHRKHPDDSMTGRGLTLVEAIAARWGADAEGAGKRVWFEVPS